jgi:GMP synthase-like glutamine amidotransferase
MKILLVNNHTIHLKSLASSLAGHEIEVLEYRPGAKFNYQDKDLVILSGGGGEGLEIYDTTRSGKFWYDDEKEFVLACDKPILGICMGFEVIASAYGAPVTEVGKLVKGPTPIKSTEFGKTFFRTKYLDQIEAHRWRVDDAPDDFEVLAWSSTGVEAIRHRQKRILATQFHPEKGGSIKLNQLVSGFAAQQPSI